MALNPLRDVVTHVRANAATSSVAVVFDLDSTLYCVAPRTEHILRSLAGDRQFSSAHPEWARRLAEIEVRPTDYSVRKIIGRLPLPWDDRAAEAVRDYWFEHFFSSDHLHRDVLYPAAVEYVARLRAAGAAILYLTGRGETRMRSGTEKMLRTHAFPLTDGALLMKPSDHLSDEGFKAGVLRNLVDRFDHVWFFENEPVIINEVRALVPKVRVVFVRSAHSGKGAEPLDLPAVLPDYSSGMED